MEVWKPCQQAQHPKLYSDLLKSEPLIAMCSSYQGGALISAPAVPHRGAITTEETGNVSRVIVVRAASSDCSITSACKLGEARGRRVADSGLFKRVGRAPATMQLTSNFPKSYTRSTNGNDKSDSLGTLVPGRKPGQWRAAGLEPFAGLLLPEYPTPLWL